MIECTVLYPFAAVQYSPIKYACIIFIVHKYHTEIQQLFMFI